MSKAAPTPPAPIVAAFLVVCAITVVLFVDGVSIFGLPFLAIFLGIGALTAYGLWRGARRGGMAVAIAFGIILISIGLGSQILIWTLLTGATGIVIIALVTTTSNARAWFRS